VKLSIDKDETSLFPYGTILAQEPPFDTIVTEETELTITISGKPTGKKEKTGMQAVQYQVPQGSSDSLVRIVLVDQHGERELFNGMRSPGSNIDISIPKTGQARMKIFLNNILVEERDI
jgi:beta-lactam-binding protein with PASTA domain